MREIEASLNGSLKKVRMLFHQFDVNQLILFKYKFIIVMYLFQIKNDLETILSRIFFIDLTAVASILARILYILQVYAFY